MLSPIVSSIKSILLCIFNFFNWISQMIIPTLNLSALRLIRSFFTKIVFIFTISCSCLGVPSMSPLTQWTFPFKNDQANTTLLAFTFALHIFRIISFNFLHIEQYHLIFQWSTIRYHPIIICLTLPTFYKKSATHFTDTQNHYDMLTIIFIPNITLIKINITVSYYRERSRLIWGTISLRSIQPISLSLQVFLPLHDINYDITNERSIDCILEIDLIFFGHHINVFTTLIIFP